MNEVIKAVQKKPKFHIIRELTEIESLVSDLPDKEVIKLISNGGFSSIGLIKFVSERTIIKTMHVSTLRVGKNHIKTLHVMKKQGRLDKVDFVVGQIMKQDNVRNGYHDLFIEICKEHGWRYTVNNNHSKLILMDTDRGKYVVETSSNLNGNPNIEHFSFEKSEEIYNFYLNIFEWWRK